MWYIYGDRAEHVKNKGGRARDWAFSNGEMNPIGGATKQREATTSVHAVCDHGSLGIRITVNMIVFLVVASGFDTVTLFAVQKWAGIG